MPLIITLKFGSVPNPNLIFIVPNPVRIIRRRTYRNRKSLSRYFWSQTGAKAKSAQTNEDFLHNLSSLAGDWRRMAARRRTPIGLSYIPCPIALRFPNISDSGRIVTVRAPRVVRSSLEDQTSSWEIHTRMPVILPEERLDSWLSGEAGKEILVPFPADQMKAWPFSARVNSPKDNDAEIIVPIELQSVARPRTRRNRNCSDPVVIFGLGRRLNLCRPTS
jgi:hypothetical protein